MRRTATRGTRRTTAGRGRREPRALAAAAAGLALAVGVLVTALPERPGDPAAAGGPGSAAVTRAEHVTTDECVGFPAEESLRSYAPERMAGEAVERIRDRGRLKVGIDQNSYLWGYRSPEDGEIAGFDIDLVRAIAQDVLGEEDPEIVYLAIPTSERTQALTERRVDMVVRTMSITCSRWEEVAFSTAYFETGQQLLAPRGSDVRGYDETLDGRRVCAADGSTALELLMDPERGVRERFGAEVTTAPNHLDCLVRVQLGLADALMTDSALAAGHVAQDPTMELVGSPLTRESYGVAMNQQDVDLVRWVNAVLEDYRAPGGGWEAAAQEWLEGNLYPEGSPAPDPPEPRYGR